MRFLENFTYQIRLGLQYGTLFFLMAFQVWDIWNNGCIGSGQLRNRADASTLQCVSFMFLCAIEKR